MSEGASPGAKQGGAWEAYRNSGVDIDAGERAVELMRASIAATRRPEVIGGLGGFASAMALPSGMRKPVLVSSTDGVGTKTAIAMALGRYDTIGQDLVAMCADDLVCAGAEPLFFLDYIAVGHVFPERVAEMVASVADGCTLAGCSLIGGETAEHPGLMEPDDFDLAGFCVGVVERGRLLDGTAAHAGDALIGIGSSGLHSNGFSLVRRIVAEADLDLGEGYAELLGRILGPATSPEPETLPLSLGEVLLTPTRIYSKAILSLRRRLDAAGSETRRVAHNGRRAARQRAARASGRAGGARQPGGVADAVDHAAHRRPRRPVRGGASVNLQRWVGHGRRRTTQRRRDGACEPGGGRPAGLADRPGGGSRRIGRAVFGDLASSGSDRVRTEFGRSGAAQVG